MRLRVEDDALIAQPASAELGFTFDESVDPREVHWRIRGMTMAIIAATMGLLHCGRHRQQCPEPACPDCVAINVPGALDWMGATR